MISGVVNKVLNRPWKDKTFYSLGLVNDKIYNFGVKNPKATEGDKVQFEATQNDRGYWDADFNTLKISSPETPVVSSGISVLNGTGAPVGRDQYWANKDTRDVKNDELRALGAARNTAIEWVKFLVAQEAIPVPKTVAAKEDAFQKILDDYTKLFMAGLEGLKEETPETEAKPKRGRPAKAPDPTSNGAGTPTLQTAPDEETDPWE